MFWWANLDCKSVFPMMMLESEQALNKHVVIFSEGTDT